LNIKNVPLTPRRRGATPKELHISSCIIWIFTVFPKDFWIGSLIWATLFWVMKIDKVKIKWQEYNIKTDWKTVFDRWQDHLKEVWIFTTVEWIWNLLDWKNIFEDWISEKLLANIWILYLVKLRYKPNELWWIVWTKINESLDLRSSAVRTKSSAKMKWVWANQADGIWLLRVEDALSWSIENVMKWFNWINSKITTDFKELLTRWGDKNKLEKDAIKLIKRQVDLELWKLDVKWLKIQTKEQRDYIRDYKLERIAEFKKLVEAKENWKIPKEIDMNFWGRKWKLELHNVREINEYFNVFSKDIQKGITDIKK